MKKIKQIIQKIITAFIEGRKPKPGQKWTRSSNF